MEKYVDHEEVGHYQKFLLSLNKVAAEVQQAQAWDDVLRIVADGIASVGYLALYWEFAEDYSRAAIKYFASEANEADHSILNSSIPILEDSIFYQLVTAKEPLLCDMLAGEMGEIQPKLSQFAPERVTQNGILAPVIVSGVVRGAFLVSGPNLNQQDILIVSAFVNHAAAVLGNIHLVEKISHRVLDLQESQTNLNGFFNSAPFMMGIVELRDNDFLHVSDNLAAARFNNTTPEAMQNKLASELGVSKEVIDLWLHQFYLAKISGTPVHFEYSDAPGDPSRSLSVTVSLLLDTAQSQQYAYIAQDITERVQIEESYRNSEQRMSLHFEQTPLAVIEWNLGFRVTKWNHAAEKIFGYTLAEAKGRHASALIVPAAARSQVDRVWNNLLEGSGGERSTNLNVTKDGRIIQCEWYNTPLTTAAGSVIGVASLIQDVTERLREEKVRGAIFKISQAAVSTNSLSELYVSIHNILGELMSVDNFYIALYDPMRELLSFPYHVDQYDPPPPPQKLGHGLTEYVLRTTRPLLVSREAFQHLVDQGEVELDGADSLAWLGVPLMVEGRIIGVMVVQNYIENVQYTQNDLAILEFVSAQVAQAIARKVDEDKIYQNVIRTQGLVEISAAIMQNGLDFQAVLESISDLVSKMVGDACFIHLSSDDGQWLQPQAFGCQDPCDSALITRLLSGDSLRQGDGLAGRVAAAGRPLLVPEVAMKDLPKVIRHEFQPYLERFEIHSILIVPLRSHGHVLGTMSVTRSSPGHPYSEDDQGYLQDIADRAALAITNSRLFAQEQARSKELSVLYSLTSSLRHAMRESDMLSIVLNEVRQLFDASAGMIELLNTHETQFTIALAVGAIASNTGRVFPANAGVSGLVLRTDKPYKTNDYSEEPARIADLYNGSELGPAIFVSLDSDAEIQGVLMIARSKKSKAGYFTDKEVQLLKSIGEIVGNSLRRARLFEDSQRRLQQTQALYAIDTAISNSHDLQITLNIFLDQVVAQLKVDAVCVLLLNHSQELSYSAGRGFMTTALQNTRLKLGEGYAGMAARERRIINIPDLRKHETDFLRSPFFSAERFITYFAIPLATESQVTGVLELYHRASLNPDAEWFEFARTLAGQAAIAIDNASLFSELERTNIDLTQAYEATIEGWSRALDLRDHETEGHTRRVTELTVQMAREYGFDNDQMTHITRGAMLHDIGKMGIPDNILLKTGPLSSDEWDKMRKHPEYARDLLSAIDYLKPAIDIPYSHHEKWNGTGYPCGLSGSDIPLTARIFSVADVWDALTSDRPYRPAWTREKTLDYIRSESGERFDPDAVSIFFKTIARLRL